MARTGRPTGLLVDGAQVRERRLWRRLEVGELAEQIGLARGTLYGIETGHRKRVSVRVMRELERVLGRGLELPEPPDWASGSPPAPQPGGPTQPRGGPGATG